MNNIKKISIALFSATLILSGTVFADTGTVTTDGLRMRKEASTNSEVVTSLNNGAQVEIIEKVGDWYKVKYYDEYEGYLFGEYVKINGQEEEKTATEEQNENKPEEPATEPQTQPEPQADENVEALLTGDSNINEKENIYPMETTTKTTAKIYMLPLITSTNINQIEKDAKITVQKELNNWVYVTSEGISGWARKYNLNIVENEVVQDEPEEGEKSNEEANKPVENTPQQGITEQTADISKGYINVSAARVRKEPSTDSDILEVLTLNTDVKITAEAGEWYKIQFNEVIGYVSKTLISKEPTQTSRSNSVRETETEEKVEKTVTEESLKVEKIPEINENEQQGEMKKEELNAQGQDVVNFAKQYLGFSYVLGGTTPTGGFDCSGFTYYVYNNCGYSLSRACSVQAKSGIAVSKSELQAGDLLFFDNTSDGSIGHVGIYIGDGNFIHAANPKRGVVIDTIESGYYNTYYYSARRLS